MSLTNLNKLPRIQLASLPTPLQELKRLSAFFGGPRLLMKRDDLTGLALGGNKTRKLEFLLADALAKRADTVITAGAAQSNHCRQTAAAAAHTGLRCELVLGGERPSIPAGNLLLDTLLGARVHWTGMDRRGERLAEVADALRREGRNPYSIPYGGSNALGAMGYVAAMMELEKQLSESKTRVNRIIVASSSGGTQAGLVVGAKVTSFAGTIHGIGIDKREGGKDNYGLELADLANTTAAVLGSPFRFVPQDFSVNDDYLGEGYGAVGDLEREAIRLMARHEGILLDPVYTGRAFGGLVDMMNRKFFDSDETVLFWHTGGAPALFAYAQEIM